MSTRLGKPQTILLVEDHADTANVFARMLRRDGFDVTIATTAASASALCNDKSFDLLICDLQLPDGLGNEVLNAARSRSPGTKAVVVSGHDSPAQLAEAKQSGFEDYFLKPIDYAALRAAIARLLS
jgi:DNA-binding NtrC family response regulator